MIRRVLSLIAWIVPRAERASWRAEWLAEFEFASRARRRDAAGRAPGWRASRLWAAWRHAWWLRGQTLRLGTLGQDVRHGVRALRRRPAFTVAAVLTLALGIGGTTVIFSAARAVLWRPLPFPDPDRLAMVALVDTTATGPSLANTVSPPDFVDWRRQSTSFAAMAAIRDDGIALTDGGPAEQIATSAVTADFFRVMGVPAAVGRVLGPADEAAGASDAVVLGDGLWRRRLGADPAAVGRRITLDGVSCEVVGVMPRGFDVPRGAEAWTPLRFTANDLATQRGAHYLTVVARVAAGATRAAATTEMAAIGRRLAVQYAKSNWQTEVTVVPWRRAIVGGEVEPAMRVLLGAVALVFLVACVNVASPVVGAALGRRRDLAVRAALGASRARLARGLFVESLVLAVIGGAIGIALAAGGARAIAAADSVDIPFLEGTRIDPVVMAFAAIVTLGAAVLFGVLPALEASRRDGAPDLGAAGVRTTSARGTSRARDGLVAGEMAMAVALLVVAGLLARSFLRLTNVPLGLDPDHVQTAEVSLPDPTYGAPERRALFVDDVLGRLSGRGDVQSAAAAFGLPLTSFSYYISVFDRDGVHISPTDPHQLVVEVRAVTPRFFETIGTPRLAGRDFTPADRRGTAPVVLVNASAARLLWPDVHAIGHRVTVSTRFGLGGDRVGGEVVGVVGDIHDAGPAAGPRPTVYVAEAQFPLNAVTFVVKPRGHPADLVATIRGAVASADPSVPVFAARTLADRASRAVAQPRFYLQLVGLFAAVAMTLAAVGVYGVMAQNVGARTRELGIRIALGAAPSTAVLLILRRASWLASAGLSVGLGLALAVRHAIAGLLFGVQPADGLTLAVVSASTLVVASFAAWWPARRAARVDPVASLRSN